MLVEAAHIGQSGLVRAVGVHHVYLVPSVSIGMKRDLAAVMGPCGSAIYDAGTGIG